MKISRLLLAVALLCAVSYGQVKVSPLLQPHQTFSDQAGAPCAGCALFSYTAGSTIPTPTYQDASGSVPNTNPIVLSVQGGANIWVDTSVAYKFVLKNTQGTTLWTVDNVQSPGGGQLNNIVSNPTGPQTITQPPGTNFSVNTSGGGKELYNGLEVATIATPPNGVINATTSCVPAGTLNQTCLENAIAANPGKTIYVPAGSYTGTTSTINKSNVHIILDPAASLNYSLLMNGSGFSKTNTVVVAASPTAGTTTFSGNFSAYSPGQTVVIEQVANNGTVPVDFGTVQTASATTLTLTSGIRSGYTTPSISLVSNIARITGTIPNNAITISGDYTGLFSTGDIIRIENITGTDNPSADTFYFEYARIGSINSSAITLETSLHSKFVNPWIAKVGVLSNISFDGSGFISTLGITNARDVRIDSLRTNMNIEQYLYDVQFSNLKGISTAPSAFFFTFIWNSVISNIVAYGGTGTTDNGNVKFLGVQGVAVSNVATWQGTNPVQGEYPLMYDFNYTPYSLWNANDTLSSAAVGSTQGGGGSSIFIGGMRNSSMSALSNTGNITLLDSKNLTIDGLTTAGQILIQSGNAYQIHNFTADSMAIGQVSTVNDSEFSNFTIAGGPTENANAAIKILNGGSNDRFVHGEFTQSNLTFFTIDAQAGSTNMYYEDLQDYAGTNLLFSLHTNITGTHTLNANRFASNVQGAFLPVVVSSGMQVSTGFKIGTGTTLTDSDRIVQTTNTAPTGSCTVLTGYIIATFNGQTLKLATCP